MGVYLKKNLLIAAPYLENIGGTEIEAVNNAVYFYDSGVYERVTLFSPTKINKSLFQNLIGKRNFHFLTYPAFFSSRFIDLINRFFNKLGFDLKFTEYLYWKYRSINVSSIFILAYPRCAYFFPLIEASSVSKKFICKITMGQFENLPKKHLKYYHKFDNIIVFNNTQRIFWEKQYHLNNMISLDIMIPNEENLLKVNLIDFSKVANINFGYLGRISREKNIEHMILLIAFLNNKNNLSCKLLVQGKGENDYLKELKKLIEDLKLSSSVIFETSCLDPIETHHFFNKIEVFLVTSVHEGGPITALEAAAAGRIVMGYDVGAMKERFKKFSFVVNNNFEELCSSALKFCQLKPNDKNNIGLEIRELYKLNLSNQVKASTLAEIID